MIEPTDLLGELFLSLFDDEGDLRRFFTVIGLDAVEHRLSPTRKGGSLRAVASEAAQALSDLGLIGADLFDELARRSPDQEGAVRSVASNLGVGADSSGTADEPDPPLPPQGPSSTASSSATSAASPGGTSQERAQLERFLNDLSDALDVVDVADPVERSLSPASWGWTGAAAVLGSFAPQSLRPLPGVEPPAEPAHRALADVARTAADGSWVLLDRPRREALVRLQAGGLLRAAASANQQLPDTHRDCLLRLLDGDQPTLARLSTIDLDALDAVMRWLGPLGLNLQVDRAQLYATRERRVLIDPLRKLVDANFVGRAAELEVLDRFAAGTGSAPLLVLHGPGGVGKSSLVGRLLLEREEASQRSPIPFVYIDFDKRRYDPSNPRRMIQHIALQLRLLYATSPDMARRLAQIEGASAEPAGRGMPLGDAEDPRSEDQLYRELAGLLTAGGSPAPLLVVLDTFEEVQMQGPGPVDAVLRLIERFVRQLPGTCVVLSGRGDLSNLGAAAPIHAALRLGDLDPSSADHLLDTLGVADQRLRHLVVERFGRNPLTLRLAADVLNRQEAAETDLDDLLVGHGLMAELAEEQIQRMLYGRILGYLRDTAIKPIASPGLIVRRIDPDVLRHVLAGPCKLDPARADELFERLRRAMTLFEIDDDGALRHRQDVRRLMVPGLIGRTEFAAIHELAIDYYSKRDDDVSRAEEIYSRLMLDQDPRSFAHRWRSELAWLLAATLEEPLSARARRWLRRRLGQTVPGDERIEWDNEDWEAEAADRARSWLASGRFQEALDVTRERSFRSPGSPLVPLEADALIGLNRLDETSAVLAGGERDIDGSDDGPAFELAQRYLHLAAARHDRDGASRAARAMARLATDQQVPTAIGALCDAAVELEHAGGGPHPDLEREIASRFMSLGIDELHRRPELARKVLHTAGRHDSRIILRAADALGDPRQAVFRDDSSSLAELLAQTTIAARPALEELAGTLGTGGPVQQTDTFKLAFDTARTGRVGQAIRIGLDHASDDRQARRLITDRLVLPPDPRSSYR